MTDTYERERLPRHTRREKRPAVCPMCGEEPDLLYVNDDDEIVGCNLCIRRARPGRWANDNR